MSAQAGARLGRVIRVTASIGNLGPGLDTLGLAVALCRRVTVRRRIDDGLGRLLIRFEEDRPRAQDRISRAFNVWPFRVCLSGAGPSFVAFARRNPAVVERALADLSRRKKVPCIVRTCRVHPR